MTETEVCLKLLKLPLKYITMQNAFAGIKYIIIIIHVIKKIHSFHEQRSDSEQPHEPSALPPCPTQGDQLTILFIFFPDESITLLHSAKPMLCTNRQSFTIISKYRISCSDVTPGMLGELSN